MPIPDSDSSDEENARSRHAPDVHTRLRDANIVLDVNAIYARATDYLHFDHRMRGVILEDLPRFDESARFGITLEDENDNLREEIRRLVHFASQRGEPDLFDSLGTLGSVDLAGYSDLSAIAIQIASALEIVLHDNALLTIGHYIDAGYYRLFKEARASLRETYLEIPAGITGNRPRLLADEKKNMMAYHALLDHVFHSLAWWIVRVTTVRAFSDHYLAVLARWSVKLKCIALDPQRWAEDSLARAEDELRRVHAEQSNDDIIKLDLKNDSTQDEHRKGTIFPDDVNLDIFYYVEKFSFRYELKRLLEGLLYSFAASYSSDGEPTIQVRTLLCRHGLAEELRHFTTHNDGMIETSSYLQDIKRTYPALQLLLAQAHKISKTGSGSASHSGWPAKVQWSCTGPEGDVDAGTLETDRLDDVVSLLTALHMAACADSLALMDNLLSRFAGSRKEQGPPQPALQLSVKDFPRIEVSLSTKKQQSLMSWDAGGEVGVLAQSKAPIMMADTINKDIDNKLEPSEITLRQRVSEIKDAYDRRKTEIMSWTVTQDSVRVSTRRYSSAALAIAVGVIVGSVPLPFVVGDRLPGVDPFQLVMFSWLLVGAFLVAAKSRYVENWPWHDFLRMQVVCHSVTELAKAGRVEQQAVLLHLLFHEYQHPLVFSGPYPGVFRHRKDSGGFNVDVPTQHATIVAAGFIVSEITEEIETSGQWENRTIMQDTREGRDGDKVGFQVSEMGVEVEGKRRLVRSKTGLDDEGHWSPREYKVIGVSTRDWIFT